MAFPKQVEKKIQLVPDKILSERRKELSEYITKDGTYLPKSVLHADLDRGMLDFVKNELKISSDGKPVPMVDILLTTQNWAQFTETWSFVDTDFNAAPPFITVVRQPEVKYGTNPSLQYTIPNRKQFYFAVVPTWNGNQKGADVYKIPQPVPVDINYSVKIVCNRMRELNQFNKVVLQKFSSKQSYTFIKGQYVPIVSTNISDESVMDVDKRKYYIQTYDFTMLGYLIDEEEFEVAPAVSRVVQLFEVNTSTKKKRRSRIPENPNSFSLNVPFTDGNLLYSHTMEYTVNISLVSKDNVSSYDVFINGDNYGQMDPIPINTNDLLEISITQNNVGDSNLLFSCKII